MAQARLASASARLGVLFQRVFHGDCFLFFGCHIFRSLSGYIFAIKMQLPLHSLLGWQQVVLSLCVYVIRAHFCHLRKCHEVMVRNQCPHTFSIIGLWCLGPVFKGLWCLGYLILDIETTSSAASRRNGSTDVLGLRQLTEFLLGIHDLEYGSSTIFFATSRMLFKQMMSNVLWFLLTLSCGRACWVPSFS